MAQAVIFPKLGQTMEEGAIVQWMKREGDPIVKGDILFEIETDKANLEVESFFEGVLLKIYVREGVTVPVNTVVGYIGAAGEKVPDQAPKAEAAPAPAPKAAASPSPSPAATARVPAAAPAADPAPVPARPPAAVPSPRQAPQPAAAPVPAARLVISPRAKTLAQDACINPARVTGTGPNGRIVEKDVRAYLAASNYDALRITPAAKRLAAEKGVDILTVRGSGDGGRIMVEDVERALRRRPVALSRMRQVIARRLVESKQTIPHFYVTVKADITDLMAFRSGLKARGLSYSVNDFVLEAVVLSLEEIPVVNSVTDGLTVSWRGDVDLGMAVSVDNGLVVPVLRAAQTLTFSELSAQARTLAEKARAGRLTPDEMTGSSFSVSNMGMLNVDQFTAIINPGEAGILAVSSGRQEPAVVKGEVRIRTLMAMTLSVDHRIVDGSVGAQFANAVRSKLEDVELWKALV
ncbi:MAG: dihydrolipoamide acetyltransferase family protein [Kiritimatiellia bacterium]|jgi:pyruvate dehydrogenase E2 component (dihydrolipoamide acetyltransferase)|nr:dihydrolipoamide acetyltransferase family protein [Kiritimatiellia bacterium]